MSSTNVRESVGQLWWRIWWEKDERVLVEVRSDHDAVIGIRDVLAVRSDRIADPGAMSCHVNLSYWLPGSLEIETRSIHLNDGTELGDYRIVLLVNWIKAPEKADDNE